MEKTGENIREGRRMQNEIEVELGGPIVFLTRSGYNPGCNDLSFLCFISLSMEKRGQSWIQKGTRRTGNLSGFTDLHGLRNIS